MKNVAVLFVAPRSYYRGLARAECYGVERDALTFPGHRPVVAHPPCAQWGRLRHFANEDADQKALALFAVEQVRRWGGVLEHPAGSLLWREMGLPSPIDAARGTISSAQPIEFDRWGGWSLNIQQLWWGHRAQKQTWLYIVGCGPSGIPEIPVWVGEATHSVSGSNGPLRLIPMPKEERHLTPPAFALWLCELASRSSAPANCPSPEPRP